MWVEVVLDKEHILNHLYTEDELSEVALIESFYQMRLLLAIIRYGDSGILVSSNDITIDGMAYLSEFEIYAKVKQINTGL